METRDTILVVDDTADVADLLRDALGGAGYRVLVAPTLEVGLTILAAFVVRLVLIDAPTPTDDDAGDFWGDLDRLARAARRIPLIVYADGNPERYAAYAAHGYAAHLAKPLDLAALVATVAGLLHAGRTNPPIADGTAAVREGRGDAQQEIV